MYMSNSTLEKLVEILRKKMNGATATETVNRICDVLASSVCPVPEGRLGQPKGRTNQVPPSSSSEDEGDEAEDGADNNDDGGVDEKPDMSRSDKNSSIASDSKVTLVIDGSVNLSGPVTDL